MIRDRGVARRYAVALFGAAVKSGEEENVLADLESVQGLSAHDPEWQRFLDAPDVLTEQKTALIHTVLDGRVTDVVVRFLLLMLRKKRIQHLPLVLDHFRDLVEEHHGIERARVVTAVPLDVDLAEKLQAQLEILSGKKVRLEHRLDPSIIGGVVVTLGDKIIDGSLRHRLGELRDQLLATRVYE